MLLALHGHLVLIGFKITVVKSVWRAWK